MIGTQDSAARSSLEKEREVLRIEREDVRDHDERDDELAVREKSQRRRVSVRLGRAQALERRGGLVERRRADRHREGEAA